jgi:RNA polymerase sigma-70 factor, ECF subfamily
MDAPTAVSATDELELVRALRQGDEDAFTSLVNRHQSAMLQVALAYVPSRAIAEEVVQEAWLGVLQGIGRFHGRSQLKTWLFRIVINRARRRGATEARTVPFSSLTAVSADSRPSVDRDRFQGPSDRWPGHWTSAPTSWSSIPEDRLLSQEMLELVRQALGRLPPNQREVITLRDVLGWSGSEVCNVLAISETNQRVLLHRARSRVRAAIEPYLQQ